MHTSLKVTSTVVLLLESIIRDQSTTNTWFSTIFCLSDCYGVIDIGCGAYVQLRIHLNNNVTKNLYQERYIYVEDHSSSAVN